MNASRTLAGFAAELSYDSIPGHIKSQVNSRILDLVCAAAAGEKVNHETNEIVFNVLRGQGGEGQSSLLFRSDRLSASQAAFYNSFVANGADMDDGHMLANGHPGVTVIPPVLALAEWRSIPYRETASAIVAGYEIYIRLSEAVMPSHLNRGFNGTGTVGTIAAAAASAKVLGLDAEKIHAAMGLAATGASGLMELNESGQEMKPVNPANASSRGVLCALLAEAGAPGPENPLEGPKGFFRAFADTADTDKIFEGLGSEYFMDSAYIKLYPACRHMHAMIDCAAQIGKTSGFDPKDAEKVILYTYPQSAALTASIRHPKSSAEAKFSLTYSAAVSLFTGGFGLDDLTSEDEKGQDIIDIIDKMEIVTDPSLEDRSVMLRGARMEVVMKTGETLTSFVEVPKGEKKYPAEPEDILNKFRACTGERFSEEKRSRIFEASMNFDQNESIRDYFLMTAGKEQ